MSERPIEQMATANDPHKIDQEGEELTLSAGARLLEARQAKQLNLRDVADQTRQSPETLEALEAMETSHLPASIVRLQAKNYARFLGLPEEEIASAFAAPAGPAVKNRAVAPSATSGGSGRAIIFGAGALVVASAIIGGAIMMSQPRAVDSVDPLAISARLAPAYANIDEIDDLVSEITEEFGIYAKQRAWIEVRGSDGTVFRNREMAPGESYYPRTAAGWTITVQDAGAFEWRLGEVTAESVGETGQALYSVSVDDALAAAVDARSAALAEAKMASGQRR
ncbi:MAG: helix-turn-helix domain-containing protein [Pseudomonadota bacterium]